MLQKSDLCNIQGHGTKVSADLSGTLGLRPGVPDKAATASVPCSGIPHRPLYTYHNAYGLDVLFVPLNTEARKMADMADNDPAIFLL